MIFVVSIEMLLNIHSM
jgi:hypothetical protein